MRWLKKYGFRVLVGIIIYIFFEINGTDGEGLTYPQDMLSIVMVTYTVTMVVLIWEVLDRIIARLNAMEFDLGQSKNLVKAILILTGVTLPLILMSCAFSEYGIKPFFSCPFGIHGFYKSAVQSELFALLIIAGRLVQMGSLQAKHLERDKALMQKELLQSQFQNLKNQINPHFLFNSFSVLHTLIDIDSKKANEFLSRLSQMYRYILDHREESMSSLERELEVLDAYLFLLKTRHEESFDVNINVDKSLFHSYVPTLSLQMLIENAVKHNLFSRQHPLQIDVYAEDDYLVVKNKVKRKGAKVSSTKVGLENIRSQYVLQTDKKVLVVESEQFFTVKLPVLSRLRLT
ncbi:MAG: histidine kinase [Cyclobacteriaceae bacterium]|nr:histidine kinase [Cyclobacteriaceae bacterium HetDA_MAG_MS6]